MEKVEIKATNKETKKANNANTRLSRGTILKITTIHADQDTIPEKNKIEMYLFSFI